MIDKLYPDILARKFLCDKSRQKNAVVIVGVLAPLLTKEGWRRFADGVVLY